MNSPKIITPIKNFIANFSQAYPLLAKIADQIQAAGGKTLVVGGFVRDLLLGVPSKDLDIEVYGLELKQLEQILRQYGYVIQVGKAFGVLRLEGVDVDWSLPRFDQTGRKPQVEIDPYLSYEEAFRRRDLTINAMGIDLKSGELIDPFHGQQDLENKVLRYVDRERFIEDPLRFYRVMQFVGRFEMEPDPALNELCQTMAIDGVSKERIEQEFTKIFLKSCKPSLGVQWLQKVCRLQEILPELHATIGVPQNPAWHPEGDVFEHSRQALDVAANNSDYVDDSEKLLIMWAAICHDLGKAVTTKMIDGRLRSIGHAAAGAPLAKKMLERVTSNKDLISGVCKLVYHHMDLYQLTMDGVGDGAYKRLAAKLHPLTMCSLAKLSLADRLGRQANRELPIQISFDQASELQKFVDRAKALGVWQQMEEPVLQGKDLLDVVEPGPALGELLQIAYLIQLQTGLVDKTKLRKLALDQRQAFKKS